MANCEVCGEKIGLMNQEYFVIPGKDTTANICKKCGEQISKLEASTPTKEGKAEAEQYLQPYLKNSHMRKELSDYLNSLLSKADEKIKADELEAAREKMTDEVLASGSQDFKTTTGYQFEGYKIEKYIKVISGEVVLGLGYFNAISAAVSNITGSQSWIYESKVGEAKNHALGKAVYSAIELGANAMIGIDFDIMNIGKLVVVCANGTAVYIEQIDE